MLHYSDIMKLHNHIASNWDANGDEKRLIEFHRQLILELNKIFNCSRIMSPTADYEVKSSDEDGHTPSAEEVFIHGLHAFEGIEVALIVAGGVLMPHVILSGAALALLGVFTYSATTMAISAYKADSTAAKQQHEAQLKASLAKYSGVMLLKMIASKVVYYHRYELSHLVDAKIQSTAKIFSENILNYYENQLQALNIKSWTLNGLTNHILMANSLLVKSFRGWLLQTEFDWYIDYVDNRYYCLARDFAQFCMNRLAKQRATRMSAWYDSPWQQEWDYRERILTYLRNWGKVAWNRHKMLKVMLILRNIRVSWQDSVESLPETTTMHNIHQTLHDSFSNELMEAGYQKDFNITIRKDSGYEPCSFRYPTQGEVSRRPEGWIYLHEAIASITLLTARGIRISEITTSYESLLQSNLDLFAASLGDIRILKADMESKIAKVQAELQAIRSRQNLLAFNNHQRITALENRMNQREYQSELVIERRLRGCLMFSHQPLNRHTCDDLSIGVKKTTQRAVRHSQSLRGAHISL